MRIDRILTLLLLLSTAARPQSYAASIVAGGAAPSVPIAFLNNFINGHGVAVDTTGNVYVAGNGCVFELQGDGSITRVAGTSIAGYSGDGGPAAAAQLSIPQGLAVDGVGNLFIVDNGNLRVRQVTPDGVITTVAGNGTGSGGPPGTPIGDGGPATDAKLSPFDIASDNAGNLFIVEVARIRKVDSSGMITTFAGNGLAGFSGDGGPAASARLGALLGVAVDSQGDVLIADAQNGRVREVTPDGIITTVAGGGSLGDGSLATEALLRAPTGVAVDGVGDIFIADAKDHRVREVLATGIIGTVAGTGEPGYSGDGGPATGARLNGPSDVAVDSMGNLLVLDQMNNRIRQVSPDGTIATLLAADPTNAAGDTGPATSAYLAAPTGVAIDGSGNVFIADSALNRVRMVATDGTISTVAGTGVRGFAGDGGPAASAELNDPEGVAVDAAGNLFIADAVNGRIRRVSPNGVITTVAGNGMPGFSGDGGPAMDASLWHPMGVAVANSGNLFIADSLNLRIRKVSASGTITTVAGNGGAGWAGDGGPAIQAFLTGVSGVTADSAGDLFIAARPARKVSPDGIISTPGNTGPIFDSRLVANGIAVDSTGNIFLTGSDSVREVSTAGVITTIASFPSYGGPPSIALPSPVGLAVDNAGDLYVGDLTNGVVRLLQPTTSALRSSPPPH